ncbi:hypothetical protein TKK_0018106 [Trichogramma kaykai]|uniref:EF-hand domain-containing protein n=1 Tax=Trichogramma kaykai TaxID=54128 RepID=A0ABD2W0Y7_9HYME
MGNKVATFSEEQLEDYQDCTYFTRKEILRLYKRFREMADPGMVPRSMTPHEASSLRLPLEYLARIPELKENPFRDRIGRVFTRNSLDNVTASTSGQQQQQQQQQQQTSLPSDASISSSQRCNESSGDAQHRLDVDCDDRQNNDGRDENLGICFEDFLEMMSVFSEHAPRDLKVYYAFRIYDFDEDGLVGPSDLERTCRQLVRGALADDEVTIVCQKVLEESDIDGDGALSYLEFEHVVTRASDFLATFHIRI